MSELMIKHIHILCAGLTITLFFIRGIWMIRESPVFRQRWTRILPPIVDTVLLVTGLTMMVRIEQYPIADEWLTAKLSAVLIYVCFGIVGLNRGRTRNVRIFFWCAALLVFVYVVSVARTRQLFPLEIF